MSLPVGRIAAFALLTFVFGVGTPAPTGTVRRPVRVLVLYQQQSETQPMLEFAQRLRVSVREAMGSPVEFYQESLDFDRFAGRERTASLIGYFEDKYRGHPVDVIVPVGSRALRFAADQLREAFPRVPVVFALCAAPVVNPSALPAHVTGRLAPASRFNLTLVMARRLQPDAREVVVIGGAGREDSAAVAAVKSAVAAAAADSLRLTVLQGLPLDALLQQSRRLSREAIVIFANYRNDGRGQAFEPLDIVGTIARAASAPMYTQLRSYVGEGVVGGSVTRFGDEGERTGRLVARVLTRPPGTPVPPVEPIVNTFAADWRQLRRWGLREDRLPAGTEVAFRELTPWQRYRARVLLALGVIAGELVLIGCLLVERARRRAAQRAAEEHQRRVDETRRQVTHMGRLALVGELAASIAHDVRQPLVAIRANAEAGLALTERRSGHQKAEEWQLCAEIFDDIIADDDRACEIIARVRGFLRREESPKRIVDVNEICRSSARLLQHDALGRRARITLSLDPRRPTVLGDPVQLQQVVVNLVLNALEAAATSPSPRIQITTSADEAKVELAVRDNGAGIPADVRPHLFEPFFTTKAQGLGLGLVIVRSIVEHHAGRVYADDGIAEGAVLRVELARAEGPPDIMPDPAWTAMDVERSVPA